MPLCSPHVFRKGLDSKPQLERDELRRRQNVGVLAQMTSKQNPSRGGRERGFTMSELLIVVAIIAVLVAIAVPVFSAQLEKSREAVDLANVRSAYAVVVANGMNDLAPDGEEWGVGGNYVLENDGSFKEINPVDPNKYTNSYRIRSKGEALKDYIDYDASAPSYVDGIGWRDCVVLAYWYPGADHSLKVFLSRVSS